MQQYDMDTVGVEGDERVVVQRKQWHSPMFMVSGLDQTEAIKAYPNPDGITGSTQHTS